MSLSSRWFLLPLTALALAVGPLGCGGGSTPDDEGDDDHDHVHEGGASGATCPTSGAPTAADFGNAFMAKYCTTCHSASKTGAARAGAPVGTDFDTQADLLKWKSLIDSHSAAGPSATNTEMPPAALPQPTTEERQKLGQWLACGAT